jgi:tRNA-dihydrouridine synthase
VKTRVGFEEIAVKEWVKHLLEAKPATISIHGRTLKQMYAGEANWEAIGSVSSLIRSAGVIYLGNGDVKNYSEALEKVTQYGVSGVLIGRAAFGNPWVFRRDIKEEDVTTEMRLKVALEHARLHAKLKPPGRFVEVRKHLGWYCKGFDGAKELRVKLIRANTIEELEEVLREVTF